MSGAGRFGLSVLAGVAAVVVMVVIRTIAGADPVVSHGLTGPGFLGAIVAMGTWHVLSRNSR